MSTFRYQHGDRPLDGYTIEHGVGRGGFGEVYYAVSDSGRQVALKAVQNYEDVELRGIRHCMNLKSPHLVSIFDVKHNADGLPFVIMEFVSGPSLRQLLDDSPEGLGTVKAAYFLREIAKGLSYLHDRGIVHRDLKPHNVFFEDGYVKIGDYSLSKAISTSHRSGHSVAVGTVHYMAPEISLGRYDHGVDIYALGVILYEMLTGKPPFEGDSVGEVLMKHVAGEVNVEGIEEPFATVIQKALTKDPTDRYRSAQEMVQAVLGAQHVHNSVSAFNPDTLSVVAAKVARGVSAIPAPDPVPSGAQVDAGTHEWSGGATDFAYHARRAASQFASSVGLSGDPWPAYHGPVNDPLDKRRRFTLAALTVLLFSIGIFMLGDFLGHHHEDELAIVAFLLMSSVTVAALMTRKWLLARLEHESIALYRLAFAGVTVLASLPMLLMAASMLNRFETFCGSLVPLLVLDWRVMSTPIRPQRVAQAPALFAGLIGAIAAAILGGYPVVAAALVTGIAMAVQISSPFDPMAAKKYGPNLYWPQSLIDALRTLGKRKPQATRLMGLLPTDVSTSVSPKLRLVALVLSLVFPIAGLHRLYVGKIVTGILWLVTYGLLGIGQLIDVIMIALGQFRDFEGRFVWGWTSARGVPQVAQATPVNQYSSIPADVRSSRGPRSQLGNLLLNLLGGILLIPAMILGLFLAIDIPSAIAAGAFDIFEHGLAHEMEQEFGTSDWPDLIHQVIGLVICFFATSSLVILMFARRGLGFLHMLRVPISGAGIVFGMVFLHFACEFDRWDNVGTHIQQEKFGPAIEEILNTAGPPIFIVLFMVTLIFVSSLFVLAWPAKPPPTAIKTTPSPQPQPEMAQT